MKALLIGILTLGSISTFAAPCTILIHKLNANEIGKFQDSFKESKTRVDQNKVHDFGVLATRRLVETDKVNPFGKKITTKESKYTLFENGNILLDTDFTSSIDSLDEVIKKLKDLRCD